MVSKAPRIDLDGIDRTIAEEFENLQDLRSYFASKYGHNFADRILDTVGACGNCSLPRTECGCDF